MAGAKIFDKKFLQCSLSEYGDQIKFWTEKVLWNIHVFDPT